MRILLLKNDETVTESTDLEEMRTMLDDKENLIWIDLYQDSDDESRRILTEIFKFHSLSVDDALVERHVPKIDDWGTYLYLSLIAVNPEEPLGNINKSIELDVFLGLNFIVTYHLEELHSVDQVWNNFLRSDFHLQHSSIYIIYQIMDELANEYMKMVDYLDEGVEDIESTIMKNPNNKLLEEIFTIKRSLLNLRRIIAPQREVLNKLSRGDFDIVSQNDRMYFRDVYDHLVRIHEIIESLRDMIGGALETYLSVVNNQLNNIMKTLTIITTLFMPLTFLTGFFGMNYFAASDQLNQWTGETSFGVIMFVMIGLPLAMFLWMRRRDWM